MTTIAYDGHTLSADGYCTGGGNLYADHHVKISKKKGFLVGVCGMSSVLHSVIQCGDILNKAPEGVEMLYITPSGAFIVDEGGSFPVKPPIGIGSGGILATAAMMAGASSKEAVKIASKLDVATGGKITSLKATFKGVK